MSAISTDKSNSKIVTGTFVGRLKSSNGHSVNLLRVDPEVFLDIFSYNKVSWYPYSHIAAPIDIDYDKAECYLLEDGSSGFVITEDNWLASLFYSKQWSDFIRMCAPYTKRATKVVCIIKGDDLLIAQLCLDTLGFRIATLAAANNLSAPYNHIYMYRLDVVCVKKGTPVFVDYKKAQQSLNSYIE